MFLSKAICSSSKVTSIEYLRAYGMPVQASRLSTFSVSFCRSGLLIEQLATGDVVLRKNPRKKATHVEDRW